MAVLAPVLERKLNTEEKTAEARNTALMNEEDRHNSQISSKYKALINPDATAHDVLGKEVTVQRRSEITAVPAREQKPFLVENARVDSDLFRADSVINRKTEISAIAEEEENEDLRPTLETIKYRTENKSKIVIDDKISNKKSRLSKLSKRDIIIIAATALVVLALFILVVINSAVLSNINNEIDYLQSDLAIAREDYNEALKIKEDYLEENNISQIVNQFAAEMGMVK